MATCLYKSLRCHAASASHREFSEPLDEVFDKLSLFLFGEKEGVHVDIRLFLEEATKEQSFQVIPACDRAFWQLAEPFEGHGFEGVDEQSSPHGIVPHYIPSLR